MQVNQLSADRQQLWTLPTFEGFPQFDLGGAAAGTPVPGKLNAPPANGVNPAGFTGYPATGYPEQGAQYLAPPARDASGYMPLPRYGLREGSASAKR
jgi:hypothetical protein